MIIYIDTSALIRLLVADDSPESAGLSARITDYLDHVDGDDTLLSSTLLRTEILCQANRQPEIDLAGADELLTTIDIIPVEREDFANAPLVPGRLRALDALHLAVAIRLRTDVMVSFDSELLRAARLAGMRVGP